MENGVETSSSCKRQKVCEEQVEDRLSSLPDSVLIHILSFLSTIDAVKTVFVPRFRHLWNFLPSLTFDHNWFFDYVYDDPPRDGPFYHEKFLHFVRHVLIFHQNATIDKFVLILDLDLRYSELVAAGVRDYNGNYKDYANREKSMASEVDTWVYFAMRKKVKVLHLDFKVGDCLVPDASYRLPSVVFRGKYLAELKLEGCEIKPSGQIQLNCLKRLFLEEILLNNDIINQILGGCSVLEELTLKRCYGLCRLGFANRSIKSLELFHPFDEKLEISCPNIESLELAGRVVCMELVDVSPILISTVALSFGLDQLLEKYQMVKALFEKLGHGKMFKPCARCILVFSTWQLVNQPDLLFRWKYVEFELRPTKWYQPGIFFLLRTSPCLETLAMYVAARSADETLPPYGCPWMKSHDFDGGKFWSSQEGTFHCLENNLKAIKISGNVTKPYLIDMIEFLLKNAMVLEKLEISTQKTFKHSYRDDFLNENAELTPEQRLKFCQKLLSLPRASKHAVILFS